MKKRMNVVFLTMLILAPFQSAFAQQSTAPGTQKGLASLFSSAKEDELVKPDQAFKLKLATRGPNTVVVELVPAKGYYLYKEKIRFSVKGSSGVAISAIELPAGEMKTDLIFGKMEVYRKSIPAEIALNRAPKANRVTLVASYQGCHEKLGVCYPPIEKTMNLTLQ